MRARESESEREREREKAPASSTGHLNSITWRKIHCIMVFGSCHISPPTPVPPSAWPSLDPSVHLLTESLTLA